MNEPINSKFQLINFDYLDFRKMFSGENRYYCYILLDSRNKTAEWPDGIPFYVGKGTRRRFASHFLPKELAKDIYKSRKIINITNDNLIIKILIKNPYVTNNQSKICEKELIRIIKEQKIKLCNFTDGGDGREGSVLSDETKRKMSKAHKALPPKSKESYLQMVQTRKASGSYEVSEETRKKTSERMQKEYILVSPSGEIISIKNLLKFSEKMGLDKSRLNQIARSKIGIKYKGDKYKDKEYTKRNLTHKGWICFYKEDFSEEKINQKRYIIKNENGKELEKVQNLEEFSKRKGISCACLQRYALKQGKIYKGFRVEINPNY